MERSPKNKKLEDAVEEQHLENRAYIEISADPEKSEAQRQRIALELANQQIAAREAARLQQERQERAKAQELGKYPFGIKELAEKPDLKQLRARIADEAKQQEQHAEFAGERARQLEAEAKNRRRSTIDMGQEVAQHLREAGIEPDTNICTVQSVEERKWFTFSRNKLTTKVERKFDEPMKGDDGQPLRGWVLPIKGQTNHVGTAILCEDGRILTGYGKFNYADKKTDPANKNIFSVNPEPSRPRTDVAEYSGGSFSSFLTEDTRSDLGLTNIPVNAPVAAAHHIAQREAALQEAVAGLLVKNDVTLPER